MSGSAHEKARELIALAGGGDLPDAEQSWLRLHLQECEACSSHAESVDRTIRALRQQPSAAPYALVQATQRRVRSRALELQQQRERRWLVMVSCLFVALSTAITTPLVWRVFEWTALWSGLSSWVWQAGFAFFWIVPAMVVSGLLMAHGTHLADDRAKQ